MGHRYIVQVFHTTPIALHLNNKVSRQYFLKLRAGTSAITYFTGLAMKSTNAN